jgi:hypothetical protein
MLIASMSLSDFKKLKAPEIKEMQSIEIVSDGEYLFTAIIPPYAGGLTIKETIKTQAEFLGQRGNSVGGKAPDDL